MVIFKSKVKVDVPKCDKLSVTLAIPVHEQTDVLAAIKTLIANTDANKFWTRPYSLSAKIPLGKVAYESALLVQAAPKKKNVAFLRFEFNPAKCDLAEVRPFLDWIIPNGGYERFVQHGICTRVDIAIDVHHVGVDDVLITHAGLRATATRQKGGTGQTYELGSSQSARYFCIYDKRAELKAHKQPIPEHAITRIEARVTHRTPMNTLASLSNPFAGLCVAEFTGVKPTDELTRLFLATCRCMGANYALQLLKPSRQAFTKRLEEASAKWWNPTEIWQGWQLQAAALTTPPPPAFDLSFLKSKPISGTPLQAYA